MEDEHLYVEDVHMCKIKELTKNAEEDDDDMTPPSVR